MKKLLFLLTILYAINSFSQEVKYKKYSYSQLFEMIENEKDTIFKLENALILFNIKTDSSFIVKSNYLEKPVAIKKSDSIIVNKRLEFDNVYFLKDMLNRIKRPKNIEFTRIEYGVLHNIVFNKQVRISNSYNSSIYNNTFKEGLYIRFDNDEPIVTPNKLKKTRWFNNYRSRVAISFNEFKNGFGFSNFSNLEIENLRTVPLTINNNVIKLFDNKTAFNVNNDKGSTIILKNKISGDGLSYISPLENQIGITISENEFLSRMNIIRIGDKNEGLFFSKNKFSDDLALSVKNLNPSDIIGWNQLKNGFTSSDALNTFTDLLPDEEYELIFTDSYRVKYRDTIRYKNPEVYAGETALKGILYRHYRNNFDMVNANLAYIDLKDFETKRLEYLYDTNPSFDTFFQWKVNQFLKLFSNYGTKPSKAITFSVYVILLFAFIYLFFPNSWDTLGNKRLMNRFEFFHKYLRRNEGIHAIYLEGKAQEISSYNDFKNKLDDAKLELPAFFISWSKPLYSASMFSSKLMTRFLKTTDVLTGKWKDLSPKQKRWKNIQIGFLLTLGLLYDFFIKALNALMLSINTFTTLGFGEIPIKGLPRYLAIIQGFIGWFMLTIFSVSLISQLLN